MEPPRSRPVGFSLCAIGPDLDSIVVAMSQEEREAAISEEPETYYVTDHYLNYSWILVRLQSIGKSALPDLLRNAKKFAEANQRKKRARKKR